jgi:hypothetical protein
MDFPSIPSTRRRRPIRPRSVRQRAVRFSRLTRRLELECLEPRLPLAVVISEFVPDNDNSFQDGDGNSSDWIELHNTSAGSVSLDGWHLTDIAENLSRWPFPDGVSLDGDERLVVFASGQPTDTFVDTGGFLHTNFQLNSSGDYIGLVDNVGTVVSEFGEMGADFPKLPEDVSYGTGQTQDSTLLVSTGSLANYFVPSDNLLGTTWTGGNEPFDTASWQTGAVALGYDADQGIAETPALGWDTTFPASSNTWEPAEGNALQWSFNSVPDLVQTSGDFPGIIQAYDFDGSQQGTTGSFDDLDSTASATFEMWFKPASLSGVDQVLFETGGINGASFTINDDVLRFGTSNQNESPLSREMLYTMTPTDIQSFIQVVGVVDREAGNTRMYVNGQLHQTFNSVTALWSGTNAAGLGGESSGASGGFQSGVQAGHGRYVGQMAIFNVYQQPLDDQQVTATFEKVSNANFDAITSTDVSATMEGVNSTLYARVPFTVADVNLLDTLTLDLQYDDGFVAYLNGQQVASGNAPGVLSFDSTAAAPRSDAAALAAESFDLSSSIGLLDNGQNILAIHGLNASAADGDFLIAATLTAVDLGDATTMFFADPTPGEFNSEGFIGVVGDTSFSVDRGFFSDPFDTSIVTDTPNAEIYFTLDGSEPTEQSGTLYTAPVTVTTTTTLRAAAYLENYLPSNIDTQTYLFLEDVVSQPNDPVGYPSTWAGRPADYELDPDVVGPNNLFNDIYSDTIVDDLQALPSISIVMDIEDLFGATGIYVNPGSTGQAWERANSVEFLFPDDPNGNFQLNSGIRVQGGSSRSPDYPKHSLRLEFRDEYGAGKLEYPLFADQPFGETATDQFDEIVLRGAFNNSWTHWHYYQAPRGQYTRDQWARDIQAAMGQPTTHGSYSHLYINGLYWGLYNIGERPAAPFQAEYFGGTPEDYDVINSNVAIDGDVQAWNEMMTIVNGGVTTQQSYDDLGEYLDIEGFTDYMLLNLYFGNADWDGHNWIAARKREAGAPFRFFAWDSEFAIALPPSNTAVDAAAENQILNINRTTLNGNNRPTRIFHQLLDNDDYKVLIADRIQTHFFGDGVLAPTTALSLWDARADQVDRAVVAESARWGDYRRDVHSNNWPQNLFDLYTRDEHYVDQQQFVRETYIPARTDIVLQQLTNLGAFPAVSAPAFSQNGGQVLAGNDIGITADAATIYYTLDGSDPRATGGGIAATAMQFVNNLTFSQATTVRTRVFDGQEWSPETQALFLADPPASAQNLVISELNYNPHEPTSSELGIDPNLNNDDFEFIELLNTSVETIDLTGVEFIGGINYQFPAGTQLDANEYLVLARDLNAFQIRYGNGVNVFDVFTSGGLSNGGELLTLVDFQAANIQSFNYDDSGSWPGRPDGNGSSLEIVAAGLDYTNDNSWRSSTEYGGSPGAAGIGPFADVVVNEVLTHTDLPTVDAIELYNTSNQPVNISGWWISDSNNPYNKFIVPDTTILGIDEYITFDESDFNSTMGVDPNDFGLGSASGDDVWLLTTDLNGEPVRFADHVEFGSAANGESFGRWPNGIGDLTPMVSVTLDDHNSGPRIGPLVISEVMYNVPAWLPLADAESMEFVEIYNPTGTDENLSNWELDGGISFTFPLNTMLTAGETLVVTTRDPANPDNSDWLQQFRDLYSIDASVMLIGGYQGRLDNGGDRVTLLRAVAPPVEDPTIIPLLVEDEIVYDDVAPWSVQADGNGTSLRRVSEADWGNDSASWSADGPTPGSIEAVLPTVVSAEANALDHDLVTSQFFIAPIDPPDLPSGPQPTSWDQQQSYVQTLTVTFSEPVDLELGDFVVTNLGVDAPSDNDVVVDISSATITTIGSVVQIHLPQGLITQGVLQIDISAVADYSGNLLDGDGNGVPGDGYSVVGNQTNKIFELTSEFNGDQGVSVFDFSTFSYWFGESTVAAGGGAPEYTDMNIDGGVSVFDFTSFSLNFGKAVVFPTALVAFAPFNFPQPFDRSPVDDLLQEAPLPTAADVLFRELGDNRRIDDQFARPVDSVELGDLELGNLELGNLELGNLELGNLELDWLADEAPLS